MISRGGGCGEHYGGKQCVWGAACGGVLGNCICRHCGHTPIPHFLPTLPHPRFARTWMQEEAWHGLICFSTAGHQWRVNQHAKNCVLCSSMQALHAGAKAEQLQCFESCRVKPCIAIKCWLEGKGAVCENDPMQPTPWAIQPTHPWAMFTTHIVARLERKKAGPGRDWGVGSRVPGWYC